MKIISDITGDKGRLSRLQYFKWGCIFNLTFILMGVSLGSFSESEQFMDISIGFFQLLSLIPGLFLAKKRFNDLGYNGWCVLSLFIPVLNAIPVVILLFIKGTVGPNKYGPDPLAEAKMHSINTDRQPYENKKVS